MASDATKVSKFLALVLRHRPDTIGLTLDAEGWADIDDLIARVKASGRTLDRVILDRVVAENDKQRFAISDDGRRIRASQGHSVEVDLKLLPVEPPDQLYHGTATHLTKNIRAEGLKPMTRRHVHLSFDAETARRVGVRHGSPVVLAVDARAMYEAGREFFVSANGVWLIDAVPAEYLTFPEGA